MTNWVHHITAHAGFVPFCGWVTHHCVGFPGGSVGKETACSAEGPGSIPWSRRSPEGNGNPLQCSCLEKPMERGAWWAVAHGVTRGGRNLVTKPPPPTHHCMYVPHFLIHLPGDGHLDCFPVLDIVSTAALNIGVHVSFWITVFLGYMPSEGFLEHTVLLFLVSFICPALLIF